MTSHEILKNSEKKDIINNLDINYNNPNKEDSTDSFFEKLNKLIENKK